MTIKNKCKLQPSIILKTTPNYYEIEPENNIFQDVVIDVTHRCNMSCKNCYIPNREIPDMDKDKMLEAIKKFPKRNEIPIAKN